MRHRAHVTLTDEQHARLCEDSRRSGLSLSELVRQAIDRSYGTASGSTEDRLETLERSFGA